MQDLIGIRVADPRDHRLVAQQALDLLPRAVRQGRERVAVEGGIERIRPELGDALDLERVLDDVDRKPLLRSLLGEVEAAVVYSLTRRAKRRLARLAGPAVRCHSKQPPARADGDQFRRTVEVEELRARDRIKVKPASYFTGGSYVFSTLIAATSTRHDVADSLLVRKSPRLHSGVRHAAHSASSRGAPMR